ncbi:excinuclease ABC subunit UvrB [Candidatus Shapirobacteria bacterium]|nr:excinuclease ABC subunit UvrB [Candidatus Shapirobacteria bacterium]
MKFKLTSDFEPTGDQPEAIQRLTWGVEENLKHQVLLGVTGSGKTFSVAEVIEKTRKPTLVISHNKTLAAQLYQEFRDFFPKNAVCFFVSYYDYYQPEAYIPKTDTYIEKEIEINEEIDKLRLAATTNILTRPDVIVVASVSCIYNLGSPREYGHFVIELKEGERVSQEDILRRLVNLQYDRADYDFRRGTFRVRGEMIDLFPAYQDEAIRIEIEGGKIKKIKKLDPLTGKILNFEFSILNSVVIYPAKHYLTDPRGYEDIFEEIKSDLKARVAELKARGKELEAHRLLQRVNYDLEMIKEMGYVNGIENYSRYFDGRKPGEPPFTLLDYFQEAYQDKWLVVIDESHMTIPQIRGMYNGDHSRKEVLIDYGFRLPAALDNRPLRFDEFLRRVPQVIYTSATPDEWEKSQAGGAIVEQLIRPTGLVDPEILVRPTENQIPDLIKEVLLRIKRGERVLVTTLTKRMAEDLAEYLTEHEKEIKVAYLHSEIETLKRQDLLDDLRLGNFDCLVGINLLREGLDLPEVSLVAILDADKEGFLRSETSLIQVMGRAARHINSQVIMYADNITGSMKRAMAEVERRRAIQVAYNKAHGIIPRSIIKPVRKKLVEKEERASEQLAIEGLEKEKIEQMLPEDKKRLVKELSKRMRLVADDLNFELAAKIRDKIKEIEGIK